MIRIVVGETKMLILFWGLIAMEEKGIIFSEENKSKISLFGGKRNCFWRKTAMAVISYEADRKFGVFERPVHSSRRSNFLRSSRQFSRRHRDAREGIVPESRERAGVRPLYGRYRFLRKTVHRFGRGKTTRVFSL